MAQIRKLGEAGALEVIQKKQGNVSENLEISPLSAGEIWVHLFLMYLPVIGWFITLYTAFRKTGNRNKRSLARATLVNKLLLLMLLIVLIWGLSLLMGSVLATLNELMDKIVSGAAGVEVMIEQLTTWKEFLEKFF